MKVLKWLKHEFYHLVPPFLFFFVVFNLLNITEGLGNKTGSIDFVSFLNVVLAAAIVAKVLILVDNLPWIDIFPKKPLIYNLIWKTWVYGLVALLLRLLIRLIPLIWETGSWTRGYQMLDAQIDWVIFYTIQVWYFILFFAFVTVREMLELIGSAKARRAFFGF